jgi:hypothetical protein
MSPIESLPLLFEPQTWCTRIPTNGAGIGIASVAYVLVSFAEAGVHISILRKRGYPEFVGLHRELQAFEQIPL